MIRRRRPSLVSVTQRVLPGVRATLGRSAEFAAWWAASNAEALAGTGPLWVALGDSTAQGIGADRPDLGYVGQLHARLAMEGRQWRLVNLSRTGARVGDVLSDQFPRAIDLGPSLVTCAIGSNDILWRTPRAAFDVALDDLLEALPTGAVIATLPHGLGRRRTNAVNERIVATAAARGLRVADVGATTAPPYRGKFASDGFHPNEVGYRSWTDAFVEALRDE
jgi:acyl-CoA thioesterase I